MRSHSALIALAAVVALGVGACGDPQDATGGPGGNADPLATTAGIPLCDDLEPIRADESVYADSPVYVGNEQPIEQVQEWAQDQDGFEELWIDRDRNGWLTVAFSAEAQARQTQIDERWPDEGIVAVHVPNTLQELERVGERVAELELDGITGWSPSVQYGVVTIDVGYLTDDRLEALQPLADEPICVSGQPESEMVPDGDQPTQGQGWRLLGEDLTGEPYRTGVATTDDQYDALWADAGLAADRPGVDFETEIVVWFGAVYGTGCPVRLDGIAVQDDGPYLHAEIVLPGNPGACNDDANPHAFVLAVQREMLPQGPFAVQLNASEPPPGVPQERTVIDADLSEPGAIATDEQIGPDEDLMAQADQQQVLRSGDQLEPGYPFLYELQVDPECGVRFLGELNAITWVSDEVGDELPQEWASAVDGDALVVDLAITEQAPDPRIEAAAGELTVTYRPATADDVCE